MDFLKAIVLAVVEGVTEFLPISSTGHLILVEDYLEFGSDAGFANDFTVLIQLPAILAVVVYFWSDLWPLGRGSDGKAILGLWTKVLCAFLPAAVLGLPYKLLDLETVLFNSVTVAAALIIGGIVLIAVEWYHPHTRIHSVRDIGYRTALAIGGFQCFAMIPGASRSAATIIGAMLLGTSRAAAAEFSFFVAIPTMLGAAVLTMRENGLHYTGPQWALLTVGSLVSFLVAYAVIAFLMNFIRKRSFAPFGYYRIVLGVAVLTVLFAWPGAVDQGDETARVIELGVETLEAGRAGEAQTILEAALSDARAEGASPFAVATCLAWLATAHELQGETVRADQIWQEALRFLSDVRGVPSERAAKHVLYDLACVHRRLGEYDQAKPLLERALAIAEKRVGKDHPICQRVSGALADTPENTWGSPGSE